MVNCNTDACIVIDRPEETAAKKRYLLRFEL
jgi:hypothetical protein